MAAKRHKRHRQEHAGMTLIEVLLAAAILGIAMTVLLTATSRCLSVIRHVKDYQKAQWVLGQGETDYPMIYTNDVMGLAVSAVDYDDYTFEREVEEDEDEDGLFVVRTTVSWNARGRDYKEEVLRYVLQTDD